MSTVDIQPGAAGLAEAIDRAERAETAARLYRYKAEELLLKLNAAVIERDKLRDQHARARPGSGLDLAALRGRLSEAADGLSRCRPDPRTSHAIEVLTDIVRDLYTAREGL